MFRGEEVVKEGFVDLDRGVSPGELGKTRDLSGGDKLLCRPDLWGVVFARNSAQWEFLAFFIALKYPCLESLARLMRASVRCFFASLLALAYSLRRVVREGVHQGFDLGEGRETWVWRRINAVRASREWANHGSSWSGDREVGAGGMWRFLTGVSRLSQSALSHMGRGGARMSDGAARRMRMGTWSEPVEASDVASQDKKAGRMRGLAKARLIALGLKEPERGNLV